MAAKSRLNQLRNTLWTSNWNAGGAQLLSDYERAQVDGWRLKFFHATNSHVAQQLEATFGIVESQYYRSLARTSTKCALLLIVSAIAYDTYRYYVDNETFPDLLVREYYFGNLGIYAVATLVAVVSLAFMSSRLWRRHAGRASSWLGAALAVALVMYSLRMQDTRYDIHVAYMLYIFNYLPLPSSTAMGIASVQVTAFTVGHMVRIRHRGSLADDVIDSNIRRVIVHTAIMVVFLVVMAAQSMSRELKRRKGHLATMVSQQQNAEMRRKESQSERLIESMLPKEIIKEIDRSQQLGYEPKLMELFPATTVLFFRICDFSEHMRTLRPKDVVFVLNALWTSFDALVGLHSVYKVETVGEEYVVASGCQEPKVLNHIQLCVNMGLAMLRELRQMVNLADERQKARAEAVMSGGAAKAGEEGKTSGKRKRRRESLGSLGLHFPKRDSSATMKGSRLGCTSVSTTTKLSKLVPGLTARVGIHTGELVAGVVNARFKLIGDTINTASRMMSTAPHGSVQVSSKTYYELLAFGVNNHVDKQNPHNTPNVGKRLADYHTGMHVCHSNPQRSHGIVQKIEGGKVHIFFPIEGKKHGYDETSLKTGKVITEAGELYSPYNFSRPDPIMVKGKGQMQTFIVTGRKKVNAPYQGPGGGLAKVAGGAKSNPQEMDSPRDAKEGKLQAKAWWEAAETPVSPLETNKNLRHVATKPSAMRRDWSGSSLLQRRKVSDLEEDLAVEVLDKPLGTGTGGHHHGGGGCGGGGDEASDDLSEKDLSELVVLLRQRLLQASLDSRSGEYDLEQTFRRFDSDTNGSLDSKELEKLCLLMLPEIMNLSSVAGRIGGNSGKRHTHNAGSSSEGPHAFSPFTQSVRALLQAAEIDPGDSYGSFCRFLGADAPLHEKSVFQALTHRRTSGIRKPKSRREEPGSPLSPNLNAFHAQSQSRPRASDPFFGSGARMQSRSQVDVMELLHSDLSTSPSSSSSSSSSSNRSSSSSSSSSSGSGSTRVPRPISVSTRSVTRSLRNIRGAADSAAASSQQSLETRAGQLHASIRQILLRHEAADHANHADIDMGMGMNMGMNMDMDMGMDIGIPPAHGSRGSVGSVSPSRTAAGACAPAATATVAATATAAATSADGGGGALVLLGVDGGQSSTPLLPFSQAVWLLLGQSNAWFSSATTVAPDEVDNEALFHAKGLKRTLLVYQLSCAGVALTLGIAAPLVLVAGYPAAWRDARALSAIWMTMHVGICAPCALALLAFTRTRRFQTRLQLRNQLTIAFLVLVGVVLLISTKLLQVFDGYRFQTSKGAEPHQSPSDSGSESLSSGLDYAGAYGGGYGYAIGNEAQLGAGASVAALALFVSLVFNYEFVSMSARTAVAFAIPFGLVLADDSSSNSLYSPASRAHLYAYGFRAVAMLVFFCIAQLFATLLHEVTARSTFNLQVSNRLQKRNLTAQEERIDRLLSLRMPPRISRRLKNGERDIADPYESVTVLQSDVVGFTSFSSTVTPLQLRHFVTQMFAQFTTIVERHGLYLVEVIGDAMLVASGIPTRTHSEENSTEGKQNAALLVAAAADSSEDSDKRKVSVAGSYLWTSPRSRQPRTISGLGSSRNSSGTNKITNKRGQNPTSNLTSGTIGAGSSLSLGRGLSGGSDATHALGTSIDATHARNAHRACAAALEFNRALVDLAKDLSSRIGTGQGGGAAKAARSLRIRLGLHSGKVVAGVVGTKDPRYHLFGDTVQIAQSMESQGVPARVHCTKETCELAASHDALHKVSGRAMANDAGEYHGERFSFVPRDADDLRLSAKYDASYLKQTYFVENAGFRPPAANQQMVTIADAEPAK